MGKLPISVNMCVYRPHPVYFREAVQSILNQTFEDFELIIVEDPSEVDGREIISDLLSDSRIRYIHNDQRTGFCAQKNLAIELSQGQYIAMMDADDISEPNRLQIQFAHAQANPRIKVHGSALTIIDEEGHIIGFRKYPTEPEIVSKAMRRYNALAHPTVFVEKRVLVEAGGYDDRTFLAEDYDLWSRIMRCGHSIGNLAESVLRYRIHASASKARKTKDILRMTLSVKRKYHLSHFNAGDWARYLAEILALRLPSHWILWIFTRATYQTFKPRIS